jgi:hypothetical protein
MERVEEGLRLRRKKVNSLEHVALSGPGVHSERTSTVATR